jgi:transcription-repair coupling factor (superfamily II helicase)
LFESGWRPLFDHLGERDIMVREAGVTGAADGRFEAVADYYDNRERAQSNDPGSYRPLKPDTLYLAREEWEQAVTARRIHLATTFTSPAARQ